MAASSEAGVLERPAIKEKKPKSASAPKRKAKEGSRKRRPADPNARGRRNQALGARGEEAAARFLQRNGYTILERNWTCFAGEADIIAVNDEALVFVEVKTRLDVVAIIVLSDDRAFIRHHLGAYSAG